MTRATHHRVVRLGGALIAVAATALFALPIGQGQAASKPAIINIMDIGQENTVLANYPEAQAAAVAAVTAINKSGGINGQKINYTFCNDMVNANDATTCADQAVADHDVAVVSSDTQYSVDILPVLNAAHIPIIGLTGATASDYSGPNSSDSYMYAATAADVYFNFANALKKYDKVTSMGVLTGNNPIAVALAKYCISGAGSDHVTFAKEVEFPLTSSDFTPFVQTFSSAGANGIATLMSPTFMTPWLEAEASLGTLVPTAAQAGLVTPAILTGLPAAETSTLLLLASEPLATDTKQYPILKTIATQMAATGITNDTDVDSQAIDTYLGYYVIKTVAKTISGAMTGPKLITALNHAKNLNVLGLLQKWTPNGKGPANEPRVTIHKIWVLKVKNGVEYTVGTLG